MADITACARHPDVETGLRCVQCDTPICPGCAVDAVVGMRCPSCAAPDRTAGLRRRPDQIRRAALTAVLGAVVGGAVLGVLARYVGLLMLIASFYVGLLIAQRVRDAASGNTVDVVRMLAIGAALAAVMIGELVVMPLLGAQPRLDIYALLQLGAAAYAANRALG